MEELKNKQQAESVTTGSKSPKSSGNRNFRKHNKVSYFRFMQKKKKKLSKR